MNLTYILPTRIESKDRLKNVITSVTYLLSKIPGAQVIVKEVDKESVFKEEALPVISKYADTTKLFHVFEQNTEDIFYKTRYLNDLIMMADTKVVCSHDVDVVYPVQSHIASYNAINNDECDVIYPYGCGVYQYQVDYPEELFTKFLDSGFDLKVLNDNCRTESSTIGWTQFYNREKVIEGYMWNENFLSWGAEDCEFYYRFNALGYRVGRVNTPIWHFEHSRTHNSHYHNPKFMDNHNLWQWIRTQDKQSLIEYYEMQHYVKGRRNASI
jgi:hypothetical protein